MKLETQRLCIRPFTMQDLPAFRNLLQPAGKRPGQGHRHGGRAGCGSMGAGTLSHCIPHRHGRAG